MNFNLFSVIAASAISATVAPGTARLRVTLSAGHSSTEVAQLSAAINALEKE